MSDQPGAMDMHNVTFTDEPVKDVPPPAGPDDVKVAGRYRLPVELDQWINQTAAANGIKPAVLVRDLLELGRAAHQEADRAVSLADVLRALWPQCVRGSRLTQGRPQAQAHPVGRRARAEEPPRPAVPQSADARRPALADHVGALLGGAPEPLIHGPDTRLVRTGVRIWGCGHIVFRGAVASWHTDQPAGAGPGR